MATTRRIPPAAKGRELRKPAYLDRPSIFLCLEAPDHPRRLPGGGVSATRRLVTSKPLSCHGAKKKLLACCLFTQRPRKPDTLVWRYSRACGLAGSALPNAVPPQSRWIPCDKWPTGYRRVNRPHGWQSIQSATIGLPFAWCRRQPFPRTRPRMRLRNQNFFRASWPWTPVGQRELC